MNTNRGIFDSFTKPAQSPQPSPFSMADETDPTQASAEQSPFTAASPFQIADDTEDAGSGAFGKPVKLPERRKVESPFQVAEPPEGFGFEAPAKPAAQAFGTAPAAEFPPLTTPAQPAASPFSQTPESAFRQWQEPAAAAPASGMQAQPSSSFGGDFLSDSSSIRQLELRAIFGVDRELNADEILQRARALSGVRHISRVAAREVAAIEGIKNLLPALGLPGPLKLYAGNTPVDFIRESGVLLAVQTDSGFAPGVRETLMIIARELGRLG
jgi:hypothetical protein